MLCYYSNSVFVSSRSNIAFCDMTIDQCLKLELWFLFKKSSEKAVNQQFKVIQKTIEEGVELGYFSKEFGKQLLPEKPKPSKLYLLPKVHKKYNRIPKGRPIIAACGSNTERILWLLDNLAKEEVRKLESFIEDTSDLL